jgi:hypothetical protein
MINFITSMRVIFYFISIAYLNTCLVYMLKFYYYFCVESMFIFNYIFTYL